MTAPAQARPNSFRDISRGTLTLTGTISGTAIPIASLTGYVAGTVNKAVRATISAITNGVNFTYDGATAPTSTVGHPIGAGQSVVVVGTANISQLNFIRASADASLTVTIEVSP